MIVGNVHWMKLEMMERDGVYSDDAVTVGKWALDEAGNDGEGWCLW